LTYTTRRSIDRLLFYTSRSGYHWGVAARTCDSFDMWRWSSIKA
jgi:hypothetical protein